MNEREEQAYLQGQRQVWVGLIQSALRELNYPDAEATRLAWIQEREDIIAQLRRLCAAYGDNDWKETDHLGDVLEKHLGRYIELGMPD